MYIVHLKMRRKDSILEEHVIIKWPAPQCFPVILWTCIIDIYSLHKDRSKPSYQATPVVQLKEGEILVAEQSALCYRKWT